MSNTVISFEDFDGAMAVDAIEHAIDASGNKDDCEAWYEAMESVLLWQFPDNHDDVKEALELVREAIDERFGDD